MSEIHGAVGAYVVNALDNVELNDFEEHLATCATCRREVIEFGETAAELARLAPPAGPPPQLRASVLSAIREVRPLPPEPDRQVPTAGDDEGPRPVPAPQVDELAARRAQRRARILSFAVAASLVVALSLGGWVYTLVQQQQAQVAQVALENQLYSAPDVKTVPVKLRNGGQASFVVSKSLNRALFVGYGLPDPGEDRRYQLWTIHGTQAVPDTLLDGGHTKQWFAGSVSDSTGLGVTIEPEDGSPTPTVPVQGSTEI